MSEEKPWCKPEKFCPDCGSPVDEWGETLQECSYWGQCPDACETCGCGFCDKSC